MPRWCKVLAVPVSAEAWNKDANLAADTEARHEGCRQGIAVCGSRFRELSTFTLPGRF